MDAATTENQPSLAKIRPDRPKGFPLFAHCCGQWAKKVRGRLRYFGPWRDREAAYQRWLAQREDLLAGRPVRPVGPDELLVKDLCNHYLTFKKAAAEAGEITPRSFAEYLSTCQRLARVVGSTTAVSHLVREDFTRLRKNIEKTWGPARVTTEVRRCRMIFTYGVNQNLIDHLPNYGEAMKRPSAKIMRLHRAKRGVKMFEAEQIRKLLEEADVTLRAMLLLAVNCGFGNTDIARMERRVIDPKTGWVDYPRPKTGVGRRCPLWPETLKAVRKVLKLRDKRIRLETEAADNETKAADAETPAAAKRHRRLVFLSKYGRPWRSKTGDPISGKFSRLVRRLGFWRKGVSFYALRHTFQTIADGTKDPLAVSAIMGHAEKAGDMSAVYRERIDDARLVAVTDYVREWLFGKKEGARGAAEKAG